MPKAKNKKSNAPVDLETDRGDKISWAPLNPEDALRDLLKVKPPAKKPKKTASRKSKR